MRLLLSDYGTMSPEEQEAVVAQIAHEARMQERAKLVALIDERIAAYFASVSKSEAGAPHITINVTEEVDAATLARKVERAIAESARRGGPLRIYRDRDEPPAVPPMRVINTTERL